MKLVKWRTPNDLFKVHEEVDRVFGDLFSSFSDNLNNSVGDWFPRVNIIETDDEFIIDAELPGIAKDDVKITFRENVLLLEGERKKENEFEDENYHRIESHYGKFQRSFKLRSLVKHDEIKADFKDGVLKISLPKAEEVKPKEIEVTFS